jgi:hypothetical protein
MVTTCGGIHTRQRNHSGMLCDMITCGERTLIWDNVTFLHTVVSYNVFGKSLCTYKIKGLGSEVHERLNRPEDFLQLGPCILKLRRNKTHEIHFQSKVNHIFRISMLLLHVSALYEHYLQGAQRILMKWCVCYVV